MHNQINSDQQESLEQQEALFSQTSIISKINSSSNNNNSICPVDIIIMLIILSVLIILRVYTREVMFVHEVQRIKKEYQQYVQIASKFVLYQQQKTKLYFDQLKQYTCKNEQLRQLYALVTTDQQTKDKNSKKMELQNQKKGNDEEEYNEQVKLTPLQQQRINKAHQQILKMEKEADQKMIDRYGEEVTNNQQKQTIIGFKPIAGLEVSNVVMAKKYKRLKSEPVPSQSQLAIKQYEYYNNKYNISQYFELPFCIVVPTFNNEEYDRYKNNLDSILQQNYSNYHIVIINDASTDQTGKLIEGYLQETLTKFEGNGLYGDLQKRIKIVNNQKQMRALPNLRRAAKEFCQQKDIFMIVDGDDELIGRQVLKLFNSQFQSKGVWFMYTNSMTHIGSVGFSRKIKREVIERNHYRKSAFATSHLRAFYTKLFLLIKQQDLQDENGEYFHAANDVAICIPILEMSHEKIIYVPEITYLYNSNTGLNNHRIRYREQTDNNRKIRKFEAYKPLEQLFPQL